MKKMNTKAWVRIVEAFIAVLIITGGVLIILSRESKTNDSSDKIYEKQRNILNMVIKNESLRNKIIVGENQEVNDAISLMISNNWNFTTNICDINEICNTNTPNDKDIYVSEVIVTSNLTQYSPKKLRFFVWIGRYTPVAASPAVPAMRITDTSGAWVNGGEIPDGYHDTGSAPSLNISNIPSSTKSLLLIFEKNVDTTDTNYALNWIIWNISCNNCNEIIIDSYTIFTGKNSNNQQHTYKGPKSNNPGEYILTVYSLSINEIPGNSLDPETESPNNRNIALNLIKINGNTIGNATLIGYISP